MRTSAVTVIALFAQLACAAWIPANAEPARASAALKRGIGEFQAEAFAQALGDFLAAQREGLDTPVLHYNLGATYYRLNRDQQAETEFKFLLHDPKFGDFARYNLGLIAHRAGREAEAREYFAAVASGTGNPHLRGLARAELRSESAGTSTWHGLIEAGAGYDDNVVLASHSTLVTPSGAGSPAASVFATGAGRVSGDVPRGVWLVGSLYDTKYFQQTNFDLLVARAGAESRFSMDAWRLRTGAYVTHIRLGTAELETLLGVNARAEHGLSSGRLRLDYALARIDGGGSYRYLTGWQNQFAVHTIWRPGPAQITVGYVLALNRRQDRFVGSEFFSVSPRRNQIEGDLRWTPAGNVTLYARGSYWRSRYADPNVVLRSGTLVTQRRVDTGRDAELGALYHISANMRLGAEYGYRANDSNFARYAYTSHRYMLRFQYIY